MVCCFFFLLTGARVRTNTCLLCILTYIVCLRLHVCQHPSRSPYNLAQSNCWTFQHNRLFVFTNIFFFWSNWSITACLNLQVKKYKEMQKIFWALRHNYTQMLWQRLLHTDESNILMHNSKKNSYMDLSNQTFIHINIYE